MGTALSMRRNATICALLGTLASTFTCCRAAVLYFWLLSQPAVGGMYETRRQPTTHEIMSLVGLDVALVNRLGCVLYLPRSSHPRISVASDSMCETAHAPAKSWKNADTIITSDSDKKLVQGRRHVLLGVRSRLLVENSNETRFQWAWIQEVATGWHRSEISRRCQRNAPPSNQA